MRSIVVLSAIAVLLAVPPGCSSGRSAPRYIFRDAERRIAAYLALPQSNAKEKEAALGILRKTQVISLYYEKNTPVGSDEELREGTNFALSLNASHVTPISLHKDGKRYLGISATFSTLFFRGERIGTDQWLDEMALPIKKGYELKRARVVLVPSEAVKKKSLEKCQAIVSMFTSELYRLKPGCEQLRTFDDKAVRTGRRGTSEWPEYPGVSYEHDLGPSTKGPRVKHSKNWCEIHLWFAPVTGNPSQGGGPARLYPLQGIIARWSVSSADQALDKRILAALTNALKQLDVLENELWPPHGNISNGQRLWSRRWATAGGTSIIRS